MRHLLLKIAIVMVAVGLTEYGFGETDPQISKAATNSMTVTQLEVAGDAARARKDYEQAIQYFEAAVSKDSSNAVLYNKLGLSELKSGDLQAARTNFQKAVRRNSKYADALNNLGAVEFMQKNFNAAAKQFKKAVALEETRATFHVNLGAAWFGQKKLDRAVAEYGRALELDPEILSNSSRAGIAAQIASPEERAKYSYMLAKIYAKRGETEQCLRCLKMAKEQGYRDIVNVYRDEEFAGLRQDARLAEVVPPPAK
jgi:tetratricopeptide (TPR) repeat protein